MTTYMRRLLFALILAPLTSGAFTRVIDLPVDVSTSSEVETAIEFYQAESVQLDLYVKRNGVRLPLDSGLSVVWRAWVDGTPGTLYINATGTVYNATAGHCRVTLTPSQANPTNQTYKYTVQLYDGTTYMGVGASGDLVVRYAPQSGSVAYVGTTSYFTCADTLGDLTPTAGRLIYGTGSAWATLAAGTTGQVLTAQGAAAPIWSEAGSGSGDLTAITSTDGSIIVTSGTGPIPNVALPSVLPARSGALLTALNASSISTGTVATARLGSGTANSGTWLRGDSSFAAIPFATGAEVRAAVTNYFVSLYGDSMLGNLTYDGDGIRSRMRIGYGVDPEDTTYAGVYFESLDGDYGGVRYNDAGSGNVQIKQNGSGWSNVVTTANMNSYGSSFFAPLSLVTAASASALTSGTVPDARFPATLPAVSGSNLTGVLHSISAGSIGETEIASTAVTPGSYTVASITVDADGRITAASSGAAGGIGGSTGATDNLVLRADGTGAATLQNSSIRIDDATASGQQNVAIVNVDGAAKSWTVITPKGLGGVIFGNKPDGTATGGNGRGDKTVDLQMERNGATQVASGESSAVLGGARNTASVYASTVAGGYQNLSSGNYSFTCGYQNQATADQAVAMGTLARANHATSFCWGGNISYAATSRAGQFLLATDAGVSLQTTTGTSTEWGKRASAPSSGIAAGDTYYDTSTNKLRCYNGTTWNDLF